MSPPLIDIASVQRWRKLFIGAGLFALLAWTALVRALPGLEHPVEHLGMVAIMACIVGRAWCSLYIGGRKKAEIVGIADPIRSAAIRCMCSASWGRSAWGRRRGA